MDQVEDLNKDSLYETAEQESVNITENINT